MRRPENTFEGWLKRHGAIPLRIARARACADTPADRELKEQIAEFQRIKGEQIDA
ncbi:MAG: hypothetical protein ACYTGQ_06730 [Planctomycetota bacterium]|jgi:hypothetical protein